MSEKYILKFSDYLFVDNDNAINLQGAKIMTEEEKDAFFSKIKKTRIVEMTIDYDLKCSYMNLEFLEHITTTKVSQAFAEEFISIFKTDYCGFQEWLNV